METSASLYVDLFKKLELTLSALMFFRSLNDEKIEQNNQILRKSLQYFANCFEIRTHSTSAEEIKADSFNTALTQLNLEPVPSGSKLWTVPSAKWYKFREMVYLNSVRWKLQRISMCTFTFLPVQRLAMVSRCSNFNFGKISWHC